MNVSKNTRKILLWPEFITGALVVGALGILFYFTVLVQGWDLFRGSKSIEILSVKFPHASTLAVNDKVKVIGVDMGIITAIDLAPDNNAVIVKMKLRKTIPIYPGYEFSIQSSSVFGGAYVNIKPGDSSKPALASDTTFYGIQPIDIITEASELIAAFREDEKHLRDIVINGGVLDRIRDTLHSLERNAQNFNVICADIREGRGTLGKLFVDPAFYNHAQNAFMELGVLAKRLDKLAADVENGNGVAGKLLKDEKTAKAFTDFMASMNVFMQKVNSDRSSLNRLLADDGRFFENLSSSVQSISEISAALNKGDGTMGKLIRDEALYKELLATVREIRTAVDDFREMAPVATFGSILLGAL